MVMGYLFVCGRSNALLSSGESLLQHVLDDPLLALARPGGKVCSSYGVLHLSVCNL
jgi:hypothetical protein